MSDDMKKVGISGTSGHRARLLERYIKTGISSLNNYEILELLLTFALPRKDTKPIAKQLLSHYGTVNAVVNAPLDELSDFSGLGRRSAAIFTLVKDMMAFCLNEESIKKPVSTHRGDIEKYLRLNLGHRREEYAAAVFLDAAGHIIGTEIVAEGTVNRCAVYPRTIMASAMRCGAASFIFAHNHPAGIVTPSEGDWQATERLIAAGKCMDLPLLDHIIISKDKIVSLREFERWPI